MKGINNFLIHGTVHNKRKLGHIDSVELDKWAEEYYHEYNNTDIYDKCCKLDSEELLLKTVNDCSTEDVLKVLAGILDASNVRNIDVMGICRELIRDDNRFEKLYK